MKFLCDQCKAKYQIADEKAAGKTIRMKCRKCGHLIEVRAAIMESSVVTEAGSSPGLVSAPDPAAAAGLPPNPKGLPRPAVPPRPSALATSLAASKPVAREKLAANTGAFQSPARRHEDMSAAPSMSELSASDEWYVAINGVPVGPIRIAEVRRKAALGAVTEDSLAWQDGLDEWRPVRAFPALGAIVREAFATGRASFTPPPPPGRPSVPPPSRAASARPAAAVPPPPPRAVPPRPALAVPPPQPVHARSNVVPITSRLATAEKLDDAHEEPTRALSILDVLGSSPLDPALAHPPPADRKVAGPVVLADPLAPTAPQRRARRQMPWIPIAMVAAAIAFGVTTGRIATFSRQPPPPPPPVVVQIPAPPMPTIAPEPVPSAVEPAERPTVAIVPHKGPAGGTAKEKEPAQANRGLLDLHALTQNQTTVTPSEEPGNDAPKAAGQCFSSAQVQQVIGLHKTAIQRVCWERNPTNKLAVNVNVSFTIQPDGTTQAVTASAEEPAVAKCVENDVRGWRFPSLGCSQATQFSYKFVRQ